MLSSFRELLNVTKNVNLGNTDAKREDKQINVNVGSELLKYYQANWEEIHEANEANAKQARHLARSIDMLARHVKLDKQNMDLISHLLVNNLKPMMKACTKQMDELCCYFKIVEDDLVALEDAIDKLELENAKCSNLSRLEQYKMKRQHKLEELQADLEENHQKLIQQHEVVEKQKLEERQRVFQEAFRNDLEQYKILGTIPTVSIDRGPTALLEEIHIDQDTQELDRFLEGGT